MHFRDHARALVVVTQIAAPPQRVFDLELDVDVHTASLAGSGERADTTGSLGLGDEVTFTARHLGLRWRMTSRVTALEAPVRFVDEQIRGPFAAMRHEHLFEAVPGGTRMTDRMQVRLPFGILGDLVARWVAEPYLRRLLRQRGEHIKRVAQLPDPAPGHPDPRPPGSPPR